MKEKDYLYVVDNKNILHKVDKVSKFAVCDDGLLILPEAISEIVPDDFAGERCEICFVRKKAAFVTKAEIIKEPESVKGVIV